MGKSWTGSVTYSGSGKVDVNTLTTVTQTSENRAALSLPTARKGQVVPYVIGRFRITNPNFIWYGNIKNIVTVTKTEKTETREQILKIDGDPDDPNTIPSDSDFARIARANYDGPVWMMTSIKIYETSTVVTYTRELTGYTVDAAIGVCLGPNVELLGIYSGDKLLWSGQLVGRVVVPGDNKDGSLLKNGFIWHSGDFDQTPDPYLFGKVPAADLPGYIGTAYIILKTVDSSMLTGADLKFEVRRLPNPLGLPASINVIGDDDINPATAAADALLNEWGAGGVKPAWLDFANFQDAAARYASEGIGMSYATSQENFVVGTLRDMQDQTTSIIYADPATSLIRVKPIRPDAYDADTLLVLDPSNISTMQNMSKPAFLDMPTHFALKYYDRAKNYDSETVINRNPVVPPGDTRARRVSTLDLGSVCTPAIAEAVYDLLLSSVSVPRLDFNLVADRNAADLVPGELFIITYPLYGLETFPVYVTKVREQEEGTNSVVIECSQYSRPTIKKFFKPAEPTRHTAPDLSAYKPTSGVAIEPPWWLLVKYGWMGNPDTDLNGSYPMFIPAAANDSQLGFAVYNTETDAELIEYAEYGFNGQLMFPIARTDAHTTWIIDSIRVRQPIRIDALANIGLDGVRAGERVMLINDEFMSFETFDTSDDGTVTFYNVHRGLFDTVAHDHAAGSVVHVIDLSASRMSGKAHSFLTPPIEYAATSFAHRNVGSYPADAFVFPAFQGSGRGDRPYRPVDVQLNTIRHPDAINFTIGDVIIGEWKTRSRKPYAVRLFGDGYDNAEIRSNSRFQAHEVRIRDSADVEWIMGNSLTGDTDGLHTTAFVDFNSDRLTFTLPAGIATGPATLAVWACVATWDRNPASAPMVQYDAEQAEMLPIYINPTVGLSADFTFDYEVL